MFLASTENSKTKELPGGAQVFPSIRSPVEQGGGDQNPHATFLHPQYKIQEGDNGNGIIFHCLHWSWAGWVAWQISQRGSAMEAEYPGFNYLASPGRARNVPLPETLKRLWC